MCEKKLHSDCKLNLKAPFSGFSYEHRALRWQVVLTHHPPLCPSPGKLWGQDSRALVSLVWRVISRRKWRAGPCRMHLINFGARLKK